VRESTKSNLRVDPRIIIALAALAAVLFYLLVSALIFRVGFPLDDAWIHFTYARNFAEHGEWAFRLGEKSAASTAPLWTLMIGVGYFLKLAPYIWTYFLGWVILTLLGIQGEDIAQRLVNTYRPRLPWVGLFFVTAWHLTWSAVSGMETLLHGYIILVTLSMLLSGSRRYLALGLLAGLSVWVRPDGLTLLGPIVFTALLVEKSSKQRNDALFKILIGFGALFVPYLLFNLALSGNPMPNTFYAKQAEYQEFWLSQTIMYRIGNYVTPIVASPFLVLIPGVFIWLRNVTQSRSWGAIAGVIWFFGYIAIYFMRLPAYQHGRYIIPALPILYLWGILGMIEFVNSQKSNPRLVLLWNSLLAALCLLFTFVAARQNAYDVYWIETEMVGTAEWVQANIPPDALLAVHDIGALGYYVPNPMIDLAGLITPDVVPFIRNSSGLKEYLDVKSADYLIVFPGQYPALVSDRKSLFSSGVRFNLLDFDDHIQVYPWRNN
jgi:hypothetical protein